MEWSKDRPVVGGWYFAATPCEPTEADGRYFVDLVAVRFSPRGRHADTMAMEVYIPRPEEDADDADTYWESVSDSDFEIVETLWYGPISPPPVVGS